MSQTLEAVFVHGEYQLKLDYTPQGAALINGEVVNMGNAVGVCNIVGGVEIGELCSLPTKGVWRLLKDGTTGPVFAVGDVVYWDATANLAVVLADGDFPCGVCVKAAGTNEDGVWVELNAAPLADLINAP